MDKKKALLVGACVIAVAGVGIVVQQTVLNNPKAIVLPEDFKTMDDKTASRLKNLSEEDKTLLMQYLFRTEMSKAFGGGAAVKGVTVGEAIESQKEFSKKEGKQEAEEAALRDELQKKREAMASQFSEVMVVSLIEKKLVKQDYNQAISITIGFQNKGEKDIAGIKGIAIFNDIFDDEITKSRLSIDEEIPAGETTVWNGGKDFNQFIDEDRKFASTDQSKIKFKFEPEVILFKDGTKLSLLDE